MGVVLGGGVMPIALCTSWSKANKWGCIGGAVAGFSAGITAWLVTTSTLNGGVINITVGFQSSPVVLAELIYNLRQLEEITKCWRGISRRFVLAPLLRLSHRF